MTNIARNLSSVISDKYTLYSNRNLFILVDARLYNVFTYRTRTSTAASPKKLI
jgi:hypothetical protein